jgi:predicted Rossmann fold flavoprotein
MIKMKIGIIGGGAAGFFSAIAAKENFPDSEVTIFEKSDAVLSKVKISGGGRCNLTNACGSIGELCEAYPRGGKRLKKAFYRFSNKDAMEWFEARGVPLAIESDGCVFPRSQDSKSVTDCFLSEADRLGVRIVTGAGVRETSRTGSGLELSFYGEGRPSEIFDKIIVAAGGSPKRSGLIWLEELGHKIEDPVPSLFSFNMPDEPVVKLMGVAIENARVGIQGTKIKAAGPVLITHWGMSGPAILKLSSFGAVELSKTYYRFTLQINWAGGENNGSVSEYLKAVSAEHPNKILSNFRPYSLPDRLWDHILEKYAVPSDKKWGEIGVKNLNKLTNALCNDEYSVNGKSTFKDEFVTCGGVSLESVDMNTMQSKVCSGLYFAGEILDIDGITGGFNFQAAWTTAFIAAELL